MKQVAGGVLMVIPRRLFYISFRHDARICRALCFRVSQHHYILLYHKILFIQQEHEIKRRAEKVELENRRVQLLEHVPD